MSAHVNGTIHPALWRAKRVLLTGHYRLQGQMAVAMAAGTGSRGQGLCCDAPTQPSLFEMARVSGSVRSRIAAMRDFAILQASIAEFRLKVFSHIPEIVIHIEDTPMCDHNHHRISKGYACSSASLPRATTNAIG